MSGASIDTLERASRFLRSLSSATQTYALYPVGYPERRGCAATLAEEANALRDVSGSITVFFHVRDRFYLGRTLLPWESLRLLRLGTEFERRGIWSFELTSGVGEQELDAFVRLLIDEPSTVEELELLAINESSTDEPSGSSAMTELLISYARGLEFLRGTASRLLAGQSADMEETQRITETFADRIAADPAQALLLTTVKSHDEYTFHHMVNVCILSIALGHAIGLRRSLVIDLMLVKGISIQIVGVLSEPGTSPGGDNLDDRIVMPLTTVMRKLQNETQYVSAIRVRFIDQENLYRYAEELRAFLRNLHRLPDEEPDDFRVINPKEIIEFLVALTGSLVLFLGVTGIISLVVAGFVLANLFLLSVRERTKEIGIRRATGARRRDILWQFLGESVVITSAGGMVGFVLGLLSSKLLVLIAQFPIHFSWKAFTVGLLLSWVVGIGFGLQPAARAAHLKPIEAIRT